MSTKTVSTRLLRPSVRLEGPVLIMPEDPDGTVQLEARSRQWHLVWAAREQQYAELFGAPFPKGKVLLAEGAYDSPKAGVDAGLCVAQYAPRPQRMSWIYMTHGLSQACFTGGHMPSRVELAVHWKMHDNRLPVQILLGVGRQMLESGSPLKPGQIVSASHPGSLRAADLEHWLVCTPDKTLPEHLEQPRQHMRVLLLLGISDAEMQYAQRVNPEMADGRLVLGEAMCAGGVYPVTDPTRACLTRRRDFHRLWESAFRRVHQKLAR